MIGLTNNMISIRYVIVNEPIWLNQDKETLIILKSMTYLRWYNSGHNYFSFKCQKDLLDTYLLFSIANEMGIAMLFPIYNIHLLYCLQYVNLRHF